MKTIQTMLLALLLAPSLLWAQDTAEDAGDGEPKDKIVAINQIPERVMATAREAKPGAFFTQAVRQLHRDDDYYYRIYASQVGRYWIIVVRSDGELMRVFETPSAPESLNAS